MLLRGYTVRIVDSQKGLFARDLEESGATVTIGSVTDRELMDRLVAGCQVVHHVAAAFRSLSDSNAVYWDVNVNGTRYTRGRASSTRTATATCWRRPSRTAAPTTRPSTTSSP